VPAESDATGPDDWRLTGQERYLANVAFARKPYRVFSETWEHDHCEFCGAIFMDPERSPENRAFIEQHPEVLTEGYTTTAAHTHGADYHWICEACFRDFSDRFGWRIVEA
jgi:hypothetical protein